MRLDGDILALAIALILAICVMASAVFLNQIRDLLRELLKTQKAIAEKLGTRV